jgi:hypothetical protein
MADRAFTDVDDAQEARQELWRVPALWHTILTSLVALIKGGRETLPSRSLHDQACRETEQ